LFFADARVDKTTIGRWIQEDPILFRAGDPNGCGLSGAPDYAAILNVFRLGKS
jgi:hypothetical protein